MNQEKTLPQSIANLRMKIQLSTALYAILFITSIIMIVLHEQVPTYIWAITLGAAILVRLFITQPLKAKLSELRYQQDRHDKKEDLQNVLESTRK